MSSQPMFLCLAHGFKGLALLQEARRMNQPTLLVTRETTRGQWPEEAADETFYLPDLKHRPRLSQLVGSLARHRNIAAIFPLDELSVDPAAHLREHLCLPGMDCLGASLFRDKLAMREAAARFNILQPQFVPLLNYRRIHEFCARAAAPWYLKPRSSAGTLGIRRLEREDQLWAALEELGDEQSHYLLEQAVPGGVLHVDSLVHQGNVVFQQTHAYDEPPFEIWNHGGVFSTRTLPSHHPGSRQLAGLNSELVTALGLPGGVVHAEFIRCERTGRYHFLEAAARVGGANIDMLVEHTSGVNLWREWLRMELCRLQGRPYQAPRSRGWHGGLLNCLARQAYPNLATYDAPEVVWKLNKLHHAGLVVAGPNASRVDQLIDTYRARLSEEFLAVMAPPALFL